METASPFAQKSASVETLIARVRDDLSRECDRIGPTCPPLDEIERASDRAVRALWGRPVKQFLHVLALREAREALSGGTALAAAPPGGTVAPVAGLGTAY